MNSVQKHEILSGKRLHNYIPMGNGQSIVDLPIKDTAFPYVNVHQRVNLGTTDFGGFL